MKNEKNSSVKLERTIETELVIVGGGLAGVSAALAAARHGAKVLLVQDRPMLGGNASSEIRMGVTGAAGDNCKETGILEELQLENYHYNPLLRYTLWDDILMSAVLKENNITLLLNTSVCKVDANSNRILSIEAWNVNEYCHYKIFGQLFIDCSGDSILRLSGAKFRTGRESISEFSETDAQNAADHKTMGNSLLFQLRSCTEHRPFIPPEWAYSFTDETIPQNRNLLPEENNFWWLEYGGLIDTVADAGEIQKELKKIAYGVWAYLKNHPNGNCRNYELDWICHLPGKRESARYIGDYLLTQNDIVSQKKFPDAIGHGGWPLDDHDPDAFYCVYSGTNYYDTPPYYTIPYRVLYSKNIENLMFAGRNISATHMGLSSTRVMGTCSVLGQAAGTAAALAIHKKETPRGIYERHIEELQKQLLEDDQFIPGLSRKIPEISRNAEVSHECIRNGNDRSWHDDDNGTWLGAGEYVNYEWAKEKTISGARLVFDTYLEFKGKRQHKHEGVAEYIEMPSMLTKAFTIEALQDGKWQTIISDSDNYQRLRRINWVPLTAKAVRLRIDSAHGGKKAHLFSFEVF